MTDQTESRLGSRRERKPRYGRQERQREHGRQHTCLVIHGFAGGVHDVSPIAEFLSSRGCTVKCSSLPGHTGVNADLAEAGYRDWLESVERDLESLMADDREDLARPRLVTIVGFSMGSLLAANLAVRHPVDALVLLNTPIYCGNAKRAALNVIRDVKTRNLSNIRRYSRRLVHHPPARALFNFRALLQKTKPLFSKVTCPVFIGQSHEGRHSAA